MCAYGGGTYTIYFNPWPFLQRILGENNNPFGGRPSFIKVVTVHENKLEAELYIPPILTRSLPVSLTGLLIKPEQQTRSILLSDNQSG